MTRFAVGAFCVLAACGDSVGARPAPDRVVIEIHHSRFSPSVIAAARGRTLEFVVVNRDPIAHELIVGDDAVHRRHERGTEARHGAVPGEVSIPAGETRSTTFRFSRLGRVLFACHLPGHLDYGMSGFVEVS